MRQNLCDPACVVMCNFGADDVKSRLSGGFVRMFETRARKRWQLAHPLLLTVQEPCDDTPSSRSARRCQVFMPGRTWVNLWWRQWSEWGPSITSVDISGFWLQWWQDLWCRESDSGIQTVLRNVSVHGAYEEQPDNKPAIITSLGCLALAWHEPKPAGGRTQLGKLSSWLSKTLKEPPEHRNAHLPWPVLLLLLIHSLKKPVVGSSSCGGDRIMFWNVWGDLRMIPQIVAFTCQSWQPETCLSWMPGCEQQRLVGWFQEVCLQWQRLCSARFYQPSHTAKPINPENQKQLAVMVI